ncbi:MAG: PHP domain-containing protein [Solirubrobacteraceae bacterium]
MERAPRFDLQAHSTSSDGELAPADVVAAAAAAGVELLALSDHDTVAGVSEALAAAQREDLKVVAAIEISALDDGGSSPRELHVLGYLIDHEDAQLTRTLEQFLGDRERRTLRMGDALVELGLELDEAEIEARVAAGRPIGRPHLAGAVLRAEGNAERLAAEGLADIGEVIRAYLVEGRPAFRLRETPTVAEAVDAIHAASGVAVWAHPFWDIDAEAEVLASVDRFAALGMDGVEAFYIAHDEAQTRALYERCEELCLLSTGSADFHGPSNPQFSRFLAFETYGLTPRLGEIAD